MVRNRLTQLAVERIKPPAEGRVELWDGTLPGFGLRVTNRGTKSWVLLYRVRGRQRRLTLGRYPVLGLIEARAAARDTLQQVQAGYDPAALKAEARQRPEETFAAVADEYLERHLRPNAKRWRDAKAMIARDLLPHWSDRPVRTVTKRDVHLIIDRIVDRGSPVAANRVLGLVRRLFNWAVERGIIEANPAAGIKPPAKERARDRLLDGDEVRAVWAAWDRLGYPFGALGKLLLLTAQRREEVAGMRWADLDLERGTWMLPRELTKSDRAHEVPLAPAVVELLRQLPRAAGSQLVFPSRRAASANPISGFSKVKRRTDELSGVAGWTLHDLRRTAASGMARSGVAPHVIERILNHSGGTISGVAAVYNRHRYEAEMRAALEAWARSVESIVSPRADSNVVSIGRRQ